MEKIEIKVNGKVVIFIEQANNIITIDNYADDCSMTINYSLSWTYTRAIQHALSIVHSTLEANKIV